MGINVVEGNQRRTAEESRLLFLVPRAAVDDEVRAVPQCFGEAGGGVSALLVAIVKRCAGAAAVGSEFIESDGRLDKPAAGKSQLLVVAGQGQERSETGRRVADVPDPVALVERVIHPIS